jgi:hypothetical protein
VLDLAVAVCVINVPWLERKRDCDYQNCCDDCVKKRMRAVGDQYKAVCHHAGSKLECKD